MAFNVGDLEATLTLDRTPFSRGIREAIAEGERFARRRFTATAAIDVDKRKLQSLAKDLREMRGGSAKVKADVDDAGATRKIAALRAKLKAIPDEKVTVKVDTDRARAGIVGLVGALSALKVQGVFAVAALGGAALQGGVAIAGIGAAAVGVLGPLAVLGLAVKQALGSGKTFKGASQEGLEFHKVVKDLSSTFRETMAPAVGATLTGLTGGLKNVTAMLPKLKASFTGLGESVGKALGGLLKHLTSPAWTRFFKTMIDGASQAIGPLTKMFGSLLDIFKNLATAGMPVFVRLLRQGVGALGDLASKTSNIHALRGAIEKGVKALGQFFQIAKNVASVVLSIFKAGESANFLKSLQDATASIAKFAKSADGQSSLKQLFAAIVPFVHQLADAVPPLVSSFGALLRVLNPIFTGLLKVIGLLEKIPVIGPTLAVIAAGFLAWKGPLGAVALLINGIFSKLGKIALMKFAPKLAGKLGMGAAEGEAAGAGAKTAGGAAGTGFLAGMLAKLKALPTKLGTIFRGLGPALSRFMGAALKVVRIAPLIGAIAAAVIPAFMKTLHAGGGLAGKIKTWLTEAFKVIPPIAFVRHLGSLIGVNIGKGLHGAVGAVKKAAAFVVHGAVNAAKAVARFAKGAGKFLGDALGAGWKAVKAVASAAKHVVTGAVKVAKGLAGIAKGAGKHLGDALGKGWAAVKSVAKAAKDVVSKALKGLGSLVSEAAQWGKKIVEGIAKGIIGAAGAVVGAIKGVLGKARGLLPFSEPRDPSSPMRGLGMAGASIVRNVALGVKGSRAALAREMAGAMREALAPIRAARAREIDALKAMDPQAPPQSRSSQLSDVAERFRQARLAAPTPPPGVPRHLSGDERDAAEEYQRMQRGFRIEDLEAQQAAPVHVNMATLIPSDPRTMTQVARGIARSQRHARRRRHRPKHRG